MFTHRYIHILLPCSICNSFILMLDKHTQVCAYLNVKICFWKYVFVFNIVHALIAKMTYYHISNGLQSHVSLHIWETPCRNIHILTIKIRAKNLSIRQRAGNIFPKHTRISTIANCPLVCSAIPMPTLYRLKYFLQHNYLFNFSCTERMKIGA